MNIEDIVIENPMELVWFAVGVVSVWLIYKILQFVLKKKKKEE